MATQSVYEVLAREQKVAKLVDAMHAHGWGDPALIYAMAPHHWAAVEKVAGVNACSAVTRQMVIDRIERQQPAVSGSLAGLSPVQVHSGHSRNENTVE